MVNVHETFSYSETSQFMLTLNVDAATTDGVPVRVAAVIATTCSKLDKQSGFCAKDEITYGKVSKSKWETAAILSLPLLKMPQAPRPIS